MCVICNLKEFSVHRKEIAFIFLAVSIMKEELMYTMGAKPYWSPIFKIKVYLDFLAASTLTLKHLVKEFFSENSSFVYD